MKPLEFLGSSHDDLCALPAEARHLLGLELMRVQLGAQPTDFKPIATVGAGAYEIRARDASGASRVIYVAKFAVAVTCCTLSRRRRRKRYLPIWRSPKFDTR